MTTYTDTQLKQALAKMLPEKLVFDTKLYFKAPLDVPDWAEMSDIPVRDTELLHLCWLVEETLDPNDWIAYTDRLLSVVGKDRKGYDHYWEMCAHATWQQRVIALAKVKGIEIV